MKWTHEAYCVIDMISKGLARKTEVERALDHQITQKEAAARLGISERQFRRILQRYRQEGDGGLVSSKRKKPSNRKTDPETQDIVREFVCEPIMQGFGPTLMGEKLETLKGIRMSKETIRQLMIDSGVWKAKSKKKIEPHYSRPRRARRGELV